MVSEPVTSDRGLRRFDPVKVGWQGTVSVYESSDAMSASVWLRVHQPAVFDLTESTTIVHVPLRAVEQIRDQLTWFLENHYQVVGNNALDLCVTCAGTGRWSDDRKCPSCTGAKRGPRRWRMGDGLPPEDVIGVADYTAEGPAQDDEDAWVWGRVSGDRNEWKGYKNGGKIYLSWPELLRRWGPVSELCSG